MALSRETKSSPIPERALSRWCCFLVQLPAAHYRGNEGLCCHAGGMSTAAHHLWSQLSVFLCEVWKLRVVQHWKTSRQGIQGNERRQKWKERVLGQKDGGWWVHWFSFRISASISVVLFSCFSNTYISPHIRCQTSWVFEQPFKKTVANWTGVKHFSSCLPSKEQPGNYIWRPTTIAPPLWFFFF